MALKIRLTRGGTHKRPFYSIVVADSRAPRDGRYVEKIGSYNPMLKKDDPARVQITTERAQHWLKVGAQPTDRVTLFFAQAGLVEKPQRRVTPIQSAPKAKAQERLKAQAEAAEAARKAAEDAASTPAADDAKADGEAA